MKTFNKKQTVKEMSSVKVGIKVRPVLETDIDKIHQWDVKPHHLESVNGKHNVEFGKLNRKF